MFHFDDNAYDDKTAFYQDVMMYAEGLMFEEQDLIANLANISALLNQMLDGINWVGFYIVRDDQLVLGPFQGKAACIRINKDQGVCGAAFGQAISQLVGDVHQFPGHIACDAASCSEVVVPIIVEGRVRAVLDIDSPQFHRFDETDQVNLEKLCERIALSCNW